MPTLYSWVAYRAGPAITITHSCGKIVGIATIEVGDGKVVATKNDGTEFELYTPPTG